MASRFRREFAKAGGRMAESVTAAGMKELLGQMLEQPEVKEARRIQLQAMKEEMPLTKQYKEAQIEAMKEEMPLTRQYKEAQIGAMKALGGLRERSMGERIGGIPTLSNISGIFSDVSTEIENRPEIMIGRAKGVLSEEQIVDLKNTAFFERLNMLVPTYKAVRAGEAPALGADKAPALGADKKKMSAEESEALNWAEANPHDPRAKAIRQKYGK